MNDLNRCCFIGRLGRDAEMKTLKNGKVMTNFSLAIGESYMDFAGQKVKKTEWINIIAYGKIAEICGKYLTKGFQVYIEGKFNTSKYTGKDGQEKTVVQIILAHMQMLNGTKSSSSENNSQSEIEVEKQDDFDLEDIPF